MQFRSKLADFRQIIIFLTKISQSWHVFMIVIDPVLHINGFCLFACMCPMQGFAFFCQLCVKMSSRKYAEIIKELQIVQDKTWNLFSKSCMHILCILELTRLYCVQCRYRPGLLTLLWSLMLGYNHSWHTLAKRNQCRGSPSSQFTQIPWPWADWKQS